MPLTGQRMSGNQFTPIVTNNNVFTVKIVPLDGGMEEAPNKGVNQSKDSITVGDMISGEERKTGKKIIGKVVAVQTDNGQTVGYKVLNKDGETVIVDPSTTAKHDTNTGAELGSDRVFNNPTSESLSSGNQSSSRVKSFTEWSNSPE